MGKINTRDDRPVFESDETGWTLRIGTWSLSYCRIERRLFQITLGNRKPVNDPML